MNLMSIKRYNKPMLLLLVHRIYDVFSLKDVPKELSKLKKDNLLMFLLELEVAISDKYGINGIDTLDTLESGVMCGKLNRFNAECTKCETKQIRFGQKRNDAPYICLNCGKINKEDTYFAKCV